MKKSFVLETDEQRKRREELHCALDNAYLRAKSYCIIIIADSEAWDSYGSICKDCVYEAVIRTVEDADKEGLLAKSSSCKKH